MNAHHEAYLKTVADRWLVWITPASRVGGEWPLPVPCRTRKKAVNYARACRLQGQGTRISKPTA
jgi:hypothetical protein